MEPKFQSSFIPKGPIGVPSSPSLSRPKQRSLFGLLASTIFTLSVLSSLGVLGYNFYLTSQIKSMGVKIDEASASLAYDKIKEITDLNDRMLSTDKLIRKHTILTPLLAFLEENTLKTVQFSNFNYNVDTTGKILLNMDGKAKGYASVALQADRFNMSEVLESPLFSNLSLNDEGEVTFKLDASIDPKFISYIQTSNEAVPTAIMAPIPQATTTQAIVATTTAPKATSSTATSTGKPATTTQQ